MNNREPVVSEFEEKVVQISRVSKKTKGGNTIGFSVLMVVGDKKGQVGVGLGKAPDVISAIRKGIKKAKKKFIQVPLDGTTIPFRIDLKKGAGRVLLKPAPKGSGVIAGGPVRSVVEAAGIRDISGKIMGSQNKASSVYATFAALTEISRIVKLKGIKLKSITEVEAEEALKQAEVQKQAAKTSQDAWAKSSQDAQTKVAQEKPMVKKLDHQKTSPEANKKPNTSKKKEAQ
ncbi:MAG: 30S ribosomal protein S5 [Patescibacteria group bacterium]